MNSTNFQACRHGLLLQLVNTIDDTVCLCTQRAYVSKACQLTFLRHYQYAPDRQLTCCNCCCRVAGNVVNDFVLGSVMFAVEKLGVRLVMVLGHTQCTIVASAVHQWATNKQNAVLDKPTAQAVAADLQKSSVPREDSSVSQVFDSAYCPMYTAACMQ